MTILNRETYSVLAFLGDMGGLYDALFFLGWISVSKISVLIYTLYAFEHIFIKRDSSAEDSKGEEQPKVQKDRKEPDPDPGFKDIPSDDGASDLDGNWLAQRESLASKIKDNFDNRSALNQPTHVLKVLCCRK